MAVMRFFTFAVVLTSLLFAYVSGQEACDFSNNVPSGVAGVFFTDQVMECFRTIPLNQNTVDQVAQLIEMQEADSLLEEVYENTGPPFNQDVDTSFETQKVLDQVANGEITTDFDFHHAMTKARSLVKDLHNPYVPTYSYLARFFAFQPFEFGSNLDENGQQIIFVKAVRFGDLYYQTTGVDPLFYMGMKINKIDGVEIFQFIRDWSNQDVRLHPTDGVHLQHFLNQNSFGNRAGWAYHYPVDEQSVTYEFQQANDGQVYSVSLPWLWLDYTKYAPASGLADLYNPGGDVPISSNQEFSDLINTPNKFHVPYYSGTWTCDLSDACHLTGPASADARPVRDVSPKKIGRTILETVGFSGGNAMLNAAVRQQAQADGDYWTTSNTTAPPRMQPAVNMYFHQFDPNAPAHSSAIHGCNNPGLGHEEGQGGGGNQQGQNVDCGGLPTVQKIVEYPIRQIPWKLVEGYQVGDITVVTWNIASIPDVAGPDYQAMRETLEEACTRDSNYIVFDIRGNGGGDPSLLKKMYAAVLGDPDFPPIILARVRRSTRVNNLYKNVELVQQLNPGQDLGFSMSWFAPSNMRDITPPYARNTDNQWVYDSTDTIQINGKSFDASELRHFEHVMYDQLSDFTLSCSGKFNKSNILVLGDGAGISSGMFSMIAMRDYATTVTIGGFVGEQLSFGSAQGSATGSPAFYLKAQEGAKFVLGSTHVGLPVGVPEYFPPDVDVSPEIGRLIGFDNNHELTMHKLYTGDIHYDIWADVDERDLYLYLWMQLHNWTG